MPVVSCKKCGKDFYAKPFWIKKGYGNFCSTKCQYEGRKSGRKVKCEVCGKEVYRSLSRLSRSKSKNFFCGKTCQTKWRNQVFIGEKHANWKHGKNSYRSVLERNRIPKICRLCSSKDVRVLETHHLDKNRENNKLSNLVWLCRNCHFLVHHHKEAKDKLMVLMV